LFVTYIKNDGITIEKISSQSQYGNIFFLTLSNVDKLLALTKSIGRLLGPFSIDLDNFLILFIF